VAASLLEQALQNTIRRSLAAGLALFCAQCLAQTTAPELSLRFTVDAVLLNPAGNDASLYLGSLKAGMHPGRAFAAGSSTTRTVSLHVSDGSGFSTGSPASVSVTQQSETPGCTVKVSGLTINTVPTLVSTSHIVGSSQVYVIEILVPIGVDPGAFLSSLQWTVEATAPG